MNRARQKKTREIDGDAPPRAQVDHGTDLHHPRHQNRFVDLGGNEADAEMRVAIVGGIRSEQRDERHLANSTAARGIRGMRCSRMTLLGALHHEQLIPAADDNPGMPELVLLEEQGSEDVHLERVENPRPRRFVKENYVAGLERAANVIEGNDGVTLVPEAPALDPSECPARLRTRTHEIILS